MNHWVTVIAVFAIFLPALVLPGPDFVAVVRTATRHGTGAGLRTVLGISAAQGLYAGLSLVGLSAVLIEFHWLAIAVRVLGGGFLIYLGLRLLFGSQPTQGAETVSLRGWRNPYAFGFLVTLTNPKALVLFASIFATSVTAQTPVWLMAVMTLGVVASCLIWYALVCLTVSSGPVERGLEKSGRWMEKVAGVCFIGFGGKVLANARNPLAP